MKEGSKPMPAVPGSTYRIQFRPQFGFDDAASLADYLATLGVSHVYASPCLQAVHGSEHGYDVVDPSLISEDLGGEAAFRRMCTVLRQSGLGQILDIVPNHMAISVRQNRWWWDVLKNGPASPYASYFDIDWDWVEPKDKLLMPVLGDHYGRVLESGELKVERRDGGFVIAYYENEFPIDPSSIEPDVEVASLNADIDRLDALIGQQHYRLAYWKVAADELDYRRFFDVLTLVGIRTERQDVFEAAHAVILQLLHEGLVDGLRVDHIDGLRDPVGYLRRLADATGGIWTVVEKVLGSGERIAASWPVAGTTGYDFLADVDGLFVDPAGREALVRCWADFTAGRQAPDGAWEQTVRAAKSYVLDHLLTSDVDRLTRRLGLVCEGLRRFRDYTARQLRAVLRELLIAFPVYRTYVVAGAGQLTRNDGSVIDAAVSMAKIGRPDLDAELFDFVGDLLCLRTASSQGNAAQNEFDFVMRFQQLSDAVMAKGVEDTAFYRYVPFVNRNEVGCSPVRFATRLEDFHESCAERQRTWPQAMITTSTHDTKRSEDVRWRLGLLSEMPDMWTCAVGRWAEMNERYRRPSDTEDRWPDRNSEYFFYETVVGAWPISSERLVAFMQKAAREAKVHTTWLEPNVNYEEALTSFVEGALSNNGFVEDVESFVERLLEPWRITSLAATLLKLTSPGVPDIYQGSELWNLTLVDPDNRQEVDFSLRRRLLGDLQDMSVEQIWASAPAGLPKLHVIHQALLLRKRQPTCFDARSSYEPLTTTGRNMHAVVAFERNRQVVTVVPRFAVSVRNDWADTTVTLPAGKWRNVLTGDVVLGGVTGIACLLKRFPVALFESLQIEAGS